MSDADEVQHRKLLKRLMPAGTGPGRVYPAKHAFRFGRFTRQLQTSMVYTIHQTPWASAASASTFRCGTRANCSSLISDEDLQQQ